MKEPIASKLAKLEHYQFLYREYKEGRIKLFKNEIDFTEIQLDFLKWLEIVKVVKDDIDSEESFAYSEILDDPMRFHAYLVYKSRKIKKDKKKKDKPDKMIVFTR